MPVELDVDVPERLDAGIEAAAYFVVADALTNVAKYAEAQTASVHLRSTAGSLHVTIADDGIGGAELERGSGLRGLADRVRAVGGVLDITSPPGDGIRLLWAQLAAKVLGSLNVHWRHWSRRSPASATADLAFAEPVAPPSRPTPWRSGRGSISGQPRRFEATARAADAILAATLTDPGH
jgi:hypothetical protein